MALDASKMLLHAQRLISDGRAVIDLPRDLDEIETHELWKQWSTSTGKPFKSFVDAVSAKQPHGLGLGQHHGWLTAIQTYELCSGYNRVRELLRPMIAEEIHPLSRNGTNQHGRVGNGKAHPTAGGTSREYLLSRLKRDAETDPKIAAILQAWQDGEYSSVRAAAIAAGIIKVADRSDMATLKKVWQRMPKRQRTAFLKWTAESDNKSGD